MLGRGHGAEQLDERNDADRDVFQFLLSNHEKIKRTVKELPNGVELFVCGPTLISKDAKPEEVAVFVDTAVSALTVVVNLQSDECAHVPIGK